MSAPDDPCWACGCALDEHSDDYCSCDNCGGFVPAADDAADDAADERR